MATLYDEEKFSKELEEAKPPKNTFKKSAKSLTPKQILFIMVAIAVWYYIVFMKKSIPRNAGLFFGALILIAVILLLTRGEDHDFMTIDEAWVFLMAQLKDMQYKYNNLPKGSITLSPLFTPQMVEGEYKMWDIRVDIKDMVSDMNYIFVAHIDPYKRIFTGLENMKGGFDGKMEYIVYKDRIALAYARGLGFMPKRIQK